MNDQHIVEYLRSRGRVEPPVGFTRSVMDAVDAAPAARSRFSAYLPAFVAVGAAAVVAVLALVLGPGRDIGPAPSPSSMPSATAEVATVDELRVALVASVDALRAAPGVEGRQQAEIDGTIGTATWFSWRPNGDQVVVTRWDLDVTETGWWMEPDGVAPATGERIYTNIQANVGDEFFFTNEGGDWQVAARDDRILAIGPGILDASMVVPWDPLMGLDPSFPNASEAEARVVRDERSDGGVEWRLDSESRGESAVQRWTIGPGGELRSWVWEREGRSFDPDGGFVEHATDVWIEFTITDGDPIEPPDVEAAPDAAFFGLPDDFPLGSGETGAAIDYRAYVTDVLDVLETYHWDTEKIDWAEARRAALEALPQDPTADQAHSRIQRAIETFDAFSTNFIRPADVPPEGTGSGAGSVQAPTADRIGGVGVVSVPSPSEDDDVAEYLRAVRAAMSEVEAGSPACGWVVDLRDYGGGAWGPSLLALGGLLDEGPTVTFSSTAGDWGIDVGTDGVIGVTGFAPLESEYIDGEFGASSGDFADVAAAEPPYLPAANDPPVAVLIGNGTARGGEQTLVAFLGQDGTRVFGGPTAGSPIVTPNLHMADGAVLRLPIWVPVDRDGTRHTTNIPPDEVVGDTRSSGTDAVLDRAVDWLESQAGCP